MFRKILRLVVVLLAVNALYQIATPVWRYEKFKRAAQELALASKGQSDATIVQHVQELAAEHKVPIDRDWITVRRSRDLTHTYIDATWVEEIPVVPGWKYTWIVEMTVDGWHVKPPRLEELR